jgi:hypothetical protein
MHSMERLAHGGPNLPEVPRSGGRGLASRWCALQSCRLLVSGNLAVVTSGDETNRYLGQALGSFTCQCVDNLPVRQIDDFAVSTKGYSIPGVRVGQRAA